MTYVPRTVRDGIDTAWPTAAHRPVHPNHGTIGYNEHTQQLEVYDETTTAWVAVAGSFVTVASASQAAVTQTQTALTDSSGGTAATTLAAITNAANAGSADVAPTANAIASLAAELAKVKTDVAALTTLANALRAALVTDGIIKGSA